MQDVRIGLVSDTHGVFGTACEDEVGSVQVPCQAVSQRFEASSRLADDSLKGAFQGVEIILHAGDVGHHGGHEGGNLILGTQRVLLFANCTADSLLFLTLLWLGLCRSKKGV